MDSNSIRQIGGGALLVAGTSIGAGMLALPVVTGAGGFVPSLFVYFLCWLLMTGTGLLLLEICLKMPPDANLVSMAGAYFGRFGKAAAWILYLFLFYCLSVAYVSGGGGLLREWLGLGPPWAGSFLFFALLSPFVYWGAKMVDRLNGLLMLGLIGAYALFIALGIPSVDTALLKVAHWKPALLALPVVFTSFSYQGIIPSLTSYMHRDPKRIRLAIVLGTSMAFVIYLIWEFLILGIVPAESLEQARQLGQTAVQPLKQHVGGGFVSLLGQGFAFFAIATSYLGVTLGLFDFLADGFRMSKSGSQRLWLAALTFLPPLAIAWTRPDVFITALMYAGGIGCALLLGLLPVLMVWKARHRREEGPILIGGGQSLLALFAVILLLEVALELFQVSLSK
jgi:tyrosine-specific transport protein